ncbi:hypothetical protein F5B21DRAFT_112737 [Xylaria acuta]|nr:hypothetical protein F5B21DRAFT_112737 [Xylaria acuta]
MLPDDQTCAGGSNSEQAAAYEEEIESLRSKVTQLYKQLQQAEAFFAQQHTDCGEPQIEPREIAPAQPGQFRAPRNIKVRDSSDNISITAPTGAEQYQQRRRGHQDEAAVSRAEAAGHQRWIRRQQEHDATVSRLEATIVDGNQAIVERNREIRQLKAQLRSATETNADMQAELADQAAEIDSLSKETYAVKILRARLTEADSTIARLENDKSQLRQTIRKLEYNALPIEKLRSKCKAQRITMPPGNPDKKEIINMLVTDYEQRAGNTRTGLIES